MKRAYATFKVPIPAGAETGELPVNTEYLRVIDATGAFEIALNGESMADGFVGFGIGPLALRSVRFRNVDAGPITITYAIGAGQIEDTRLQTTSELTVREVVQPVQVEDGAGNSFADLLTLLQSPTALRAPLTDLTNATGYDVTNATAVVLSAAANANGAVIRVGSVAANGGSARIEVDGVPILVANATYSVSEVIRDVFVPPGAEIELSAAANCYADVWLEIL